MLSPDAHLIGDRQNQPHHPPRLLHPRLLHPRLLHPRLLLLLLLLLLPLPLPLLLLPRHHPNQRF